MNRGIRRDRLLDLRAQHAVTCEHEVDPVGPLGHVCGRQKGLDALPGSELAEERHVALGQAVPAARSGPEQLVVCAVRAHDDVIAAGLGLQPLGQCLGYRDDRIGAPVLSPLEPRDEPGERPHAGPRDERVFPRTVRFLDDRHLQPRGVRSDRPGEYMHTNIECIVGTQGARQTPLHSSDAPQPAEDTRHRTRGILGVVEVDRPPGILDGPHDFEDGSPSVLTLHNRLGAHVGEASLRVATAHGAKRPSSALNLQFRSGPTERTDYRIHWRS